MKSKLRTFVFRQILNIWPCIRGTGVRIVALTEDFTYLKVRLPLSWRTRNLVGTIYGGSLYASTDPFYMLMLIEILGKDFVVWDKGCTIRFKRPAKETLWAEFRVTPEMLVDVRKKVAESNEADFIWTIEYKNKAGTVYATFDKVLYVATKSFYEEKLRKREAKSHR